MKTTPQPTTAIIRKKSEEGEEEADRYSWDPAGRTVPPLAPYCDPLLALITGLVAGLVASALVVYTIVYVVLP